MNQFIRVNNHKPLQLRGYVGWAVGIQWFQRPIGAVVEITWFVGAIILLSPFLR
jgi:hypothetical protein